MSQHTRFRDLKIALLTGVLTEPLFAGVLFVLAGELAGRHKWLESQMPGAQISELIFAHVGLPAALAFAIAFQAAVFVILTLGGLNLLRMLRSTPERRQQRRGLW
jgi:hypothetical protein